MQLPSIRVIQFSGAESVRVVLGLILFFLCQTAAGQDNQASPTVWKWADVELLGHHTVERNEILEHVPLKIGAEYSFDRESWDRCSEKLKAEFGFHAVHVSAVRFVGGKAYLVVDVVEKGNESHDAFRESPDGEVSIPNELTEAYQKLSNYQNQLFEKGTPAPEKSDKGYLDYKEPELTKMVGELVRLTPPHRQRLLQVVKNDSSPRTRATASTLLNWAGQTEDTIMEILPYLNDQSGAVRNNLTRFMLHYFDTIESEENRRKIIDALVPQLSWPSHADRNKALYALLAIVKNRDDELEYVMKRAKVQIQYIADNSILFNVRDPARELLELADNR